MKNLTFPELKEKYINTTINGLKILNLYKNSGADCLCPCGKVFFTRLHKIKSGHTKSCGCMYWRKVGELPVHHFNRIKRQAKSKGRDFDLDMDFLWKLFLEQNKKCAITGIPICFRRGSQIYNGTASLDRKDSSKGYLKTNVQWVHKDINLMKRDMSDSSFIEMSRYVTNNNSNLIFDLGTCRGRIIKEELITAFATV